MSQHLFIDNRESRLRLQGNSLQIKTPGRPVAHVPLHMLEQVTLVADIELSTHLIHKLCSQGVGLSLINGRSKGEATQCVNLIHGNHQRRLSQYRAVLQPEQCLEWSRLLVRWKLQTQRRALQRYGLRRPDLAGRARMAAERIQELQQQVVTADQAQLLGLEGTASRAYFALYQQILPESLDFTGRNKRPPRDPVNALLSLTYSLLTNECARALQITGLDPAYGVYHQVSYSRPSLACDLVELFRTRADHFVWRLVAKQELRAHHFSRQLSACLLKKEGRQIYFPLYQFRLAGCRRQIHQLAKRMARMLHLEEDA